MIRTDASSNSQAIDPPSDPGIGSARPAIGEPTDEQRRGMRLAVVIQCFMGPAFLMLTSSGLLLLYFTALGMAESWTMTLLAIPMGVATLIRLPIAFLADRVGKLRVALIGSTGLAVGFGLLTLSGFAQGPLRNWVTLLGVFGFGCSLAMVGATWFALLSPIVPESMRGRFFANLRLTWVTVGLAITGFCSLLLSKDSPIWAFQIALLVATAMLAVRVPLMARMPELEPVSPDREPLPVLPTLMTILRADGFAPFCSYIFLLALFTSGAMQLLTLIESRTMGLSDAVVVQLGILTTVGSLAGFVFGGRTIDRWGTKPAFLICHGGFALVMIVFLMRGFWPWPPLATAVFAHLVYGMVHALVGLALSTEILSLIPPENKSVSTSIGIGAYAGGTSLSTAGVGWVLGLGVLAESWTLLGQTMSSYDALLLGMAAMVVLLVVTLSLVPSVIRPPGWVPTNG